MKKEIPNAIVLFTIGLLGGTFFYAKFNVLPTFREVPTEVHLSFRVALMKHNGIIVQSLMAIAIISSIWFTWTIRKQRNTLIFASIAILLTIATLLITRLGNVPINAQIKTWLLTAPPDNWITILDRWDFFHTCRTTTAIGSFISVLIATFSKSNLILKPNLHE
jgi:hypothetical protein